MFNEDFTTMFKTKIYTNDNFFHVCDVILHKYGDHRMIAYQSCKHLFLLPNIETLGISISTNHSWYYVINNYLYLHSTSLNRYSVSHRYNRVCMTLWIFFMFLSSYESWKKHMLAACDVKDGWPFSGFLHIYASDEYIFLITSMDIYGMFLFFFKSVRKMQISSNRYLERINIS